MRQAQLCTEAVSVCCPYCGECQPNHTGSEMWLPEDFEKKHGKHTCVSCDKPILIVAGSKVHYGR